VHTRQHRLDPLDPPVTRNPYLETEGRRGATPIDRCYAPGQQLISNASGNHITSVDAQVAAAWRKGLLIFRDTPLADAVEAVNRYRSGKIILTNEALASRPVNGLFHTDQIDNAVDQFQQLLHVDVTHLPGGVVLLG
jgi:transmembrane sensor